MEPILIPTTLDAIQQRLNYSGPSDISKKTVKMLQCACDLLLPRDSGRRYVVTEVLPEATVITGKVAIILSLAAGALYLNGTVGHYLFSDDDRIHSRHDRHPYTAMVEDQMMGMGPSMLLTAATVISLGICLILTTTVCVWSEEKYSKFLTWQKQKRDLLDEEAGKLP